MFGPSGTTVVYGRIANVNIIARIACDFCASEQRTGVIIPDPNFVGLITVFEGDSYVIPDAGAYIRSVPLELPRKTAAVAYPEPDFCSSAVIVGR